MLKNLTTSLGVHMVKDGFNKEYELAVMVTNDSDLLEPMRIVQEELKLPVGLVNPQKKASFHLKQEAHFIKHVRNNILKKTTVLCYVERWYWNISQTSKLVAFYTNFT